jgi:pimeloyl-ACP methyl ester carboxylesterase
MIVAGKRIETAWWGPFPEAAPTLVLLHEGLGSVGLWRDFPERLVAATGCGVFAYSRPGYGRSDPQPLPWPVTYMHEHARDILGPVLDAAGVRRSMLVGHSDGASIAAIYAGTHRDARIRGLVLMAPHFFVEDICIDAITAARTAYGQGLRARLAKWHDHVDLAFGGWNGAWLDPGFRRFDIRAEVAQIAVPVLQLQGTDDPYGTEAQPRAAEAAAACPIDTVVLAARHAPHFEAQAETLASISGFARDLRRT